jgi:Tfp pilus assembly protein FimT
MGRDGFGLLEIFVVAAIVLAVLLLTIPSVIRTLDIYSLDVSAAMLKGKLLEARINAVKRNRQSWLSVNTTDGTVIVQSTEGSPAVTVDVGTAGWLSDGVSFISGTPSQVTFDSLGRPTSPQTVTLRASQSSLQRVVSVSVSGKVSVN